MLVQLFELSWFPWGGRSAPSALTVSKCENFDPSFSLKFDSQNTFYLILRGLVNAFFMSLTPLLYRYMTFFDRGAASSKEEWWFLEVYENDFFLV